MYIVRVLGQFCSLSIFCQNCHVYCQSVWSIMSIVSIFSKLPCLLSKCWANYVHCQYFVKIVMSFVRVLGQLCSLSVFCQNCHVYCQSAGQLCPLSVFCQNCH